MKEPISGETIFEEFVEILSGIKKQLQCKIRMHLLRFSPLRTQTSKNGGYINIIVGNGPENQGLRKPGATSRLTSKERSRKPKDNPGP